MWPLNSQEAFHSPCQKQTKALPTSHPFVLLPPCISHSAKRNALIRGWSGPKGPFCIPQPTTSPWTVSIFLSPIFFFLITVHLKEFWLASNALPPVGWNFCDSTSVLLALFSGKSQCGELFWHRSLVIAILEAAAELFRGPHSGNLRSSGTSPLF